MGQLASYLSTANHFQVRCVHVLVLNNHLLGEQHISRTVQGDFLGTSTVQGAASVICIDSDHEPELFSNV